MADAPTNKTFQFDLVSPEKVVFSQEVVMATIPGEEGEFGVLAGHAPLLSAVRAGTVTLTLPDNSKSKIFVSGGFADVNGNLCSLLAEEAQDVKDLDKNEVRLKLSALRDDYVLAMSEDRLRAVLIQKQIEVAEARVAAAAAA